MNEFPSSFASFKQLKEVIFNGEGIESIKNFLDAIGDPAPPIMALQLDSNNIKSIDGIGKKLGKTLKSISMLNNGTSIRDMNIKWNDIKGLEWISVDDCRAINALRPSNASNPTCYEPRDIPGMAVNRPHVRRR
jgi:hypothetical protein